MEDDRTKKWKMTCKKIGGRRRQKKKLDKKWKTTWIKNGRRPKQNIKKMEDNLKHNLKRSTLISCDILVN
jgi:hypothetical protein